ncbi:MAG: TRAP transporter small permease [Lachnospiraceae bacterium]|jgi:TRAP-type C4-dicarboxylate transport system permease small subunit|nr:TRAP transporter small permease [Lachnospiraceae bacterium]
MKGLKKVLSYITSAEYAVMIAAFAAMVLAYFISVVNRNLIKASMPWTEEIALYSMTYMALLGTEVGLRDGTQVAVTAVVDKLHGMARKIVDLIAQIVLEIFAFVMLKAGLALFLKQMQTGQTTPVLKIPMSVMYFSLVLAFGLIFLIQAVELVEKLMGMAKKDEEVAS